MIRYAITFMSGSLVPVICIYLTGGSNRTNLVIGLTLGLSLILIPLLAWRLQSARALLALDHALKVFAGVFKYGKLPAKVASNVNKAINDTSVAKAHSPKRFDVHDDVEFLKGLDGLGLELIPDPMVGDVASALINKGTERRKAERVAKQVARHQKYEKFEDMFEDALDVVKAGA